VKHSINRFHTTALYSPTRVALLTGRNHHTNNAGAIMDVATALPGNTGARPQSVTPLAEILRQNNYSAAAFGRPRGTKTLASTLRRIMKGRPLESVVVKLGNQPKEPQQRAASAEREKEASYEHQVYWHGCASGNDRHRGAE
jgi:arylsulfatase A-like enzyme